MPFPALIPGLEGPGFTPASYPGDDGDGTSGGSLFGTPVASPRGFSVGFSDPALAENPAWTWVDDPAGDYIVQGFSIDRGRVYEFDRATTGTARVRVFDTSGDWDPTNTTGAFYGLLQPMKQAALAIKNPVTSTWSTLFRGFVSDWDYVLHPTENYIGVEILLVDALDLIAAVELVAGGNYGNATAGTGAEGDVFYPQDPNTNAVQTRINRVLDEIGWPAGLRSIFTGNVKLQEVVYPSRTSALTVINDAGDAEFPAVSQFYLSKTGVARFRGRLARFNPTDPQYGITTWQLGDDAAHLAFPTTVCPIAPPLQYRRDKEHVYTSAIATPQNIDDGDIAGQYVNDAAAAATYGTRTWSAENLLTAGGTGTTAAVETKKFATYYVNNYKTPLTRVGQLSFRCAQPSGNRASAEWAFVSGVDIGDRILLTTTHGGGGGFNDYFYVEGIHLDAQPMTTTNHDITMTLDVSPVGHYTSFPS